MKPCEDAPVNAAFSCPLLQLTNENLGDDLEQLLEDAELDEAQERKVEREFAREYHLITRDERLKAVAEDIVQHFMGRGHRGKGMVICIDKATAVRMYDKVQTHWSNYLDKLKTALPVAPEAERDMLTAKITEMEAIDMAVVVSQGQNEGEDLAANRNAHSEHLSKSRHGRVTTHPAGKRPHDPIPGGQLASSSGAAFAG